MDARVRRVVAAVQAGHGGLDALPSVTGEVEAAAVDFVREFGRSPPAVVRSISGHNASVAGECAAAVLACVHAALARSRAAPCGACRAAYDDDASADAIDMPPRGHGPAAAAAVTPPAAPASAASATAGATAAAAPNVPAAREAGGSTGDVGGGSAGAPGSAVLPHMPACIAWFKSALRSRHVQHVAAECGALDVVLAVAELCAAHSSGSGDRAQCAWFAASQAGCDALKAANNIFVVVPGARDMFMAHEASHAPLVRLLSCRHRCGARFLTTLCRVAERLVSDSPASARMLLSSEHGARVFQGLVSVLAECVRRRQPPFPAGKGRLDLVLALLDMLFAVAGATEVAPADGSPAPKHLREPIAQLALLLVEVRALLLCCAVCCCLCWAWLRCCAVCCPI